MTSRFSLDPRLQNDTLPVGQLASSVLLLMNDARYPWCILVPRHEGATEITDLRPGQQALLWQDAALVSNAMKHLFDADKMNVAALGNVVSQLHVHVIARRRDDDVWPAPVWGKLPTIAYADAQAMARVAQLREALASALAPGA